MYDQLLFPLLSLGFVLHTNMRAVLGITVLSVFIYHSNYLLQIHVRRKLVQNTKNVWRKLEGDLSASVQHVNPLMTLFAAQMKEPILVYVS